MMFGYLGVTVYAVLIGLVLRVVDGLRRCSLNLIISGFLLSACCYSVMGQIDFFTRSNNLWNAIDSHFKGNDRVPTPATKGPV